MTDAEQRVAKRTHALLAIAALGSKRAAWSLEGAFEVEVVGYWPDAVVGDSDRLASLALDALEGVAYRSDRQVRRVTGSVIADGSAPRTEVIVRRLEVDPVQRRERTKARNQYDPSVVSVPGSTLRDALRERGMTQAELALRMGRPKKTISEIVTGKAAITADTALQLEAVLDIPASFWLAREQKYRESLARQRAGRRG